MVHEVFKKYTKNICNRESYRKNILENSGIGYILELTHYF